jgi:hypothetical protein
MDALAVAFFSRHANSQGQTEEQMRESQSLMKLRTMAVVELISAVARNPQHANLFAAAKRHDASGRRDISSACRSLSRLNIQLANVLGDISGESGQAPSGPSWR